MHTRIIREVVADGQVQATAVTFGDCPENMAIVAGHILVAHLIAADMAAGLSWDSSDRESVVTISEGAWAYCYRSQRKLVARAVRETVRETRRIWAAKLLRRVA